MDRHLASVTRVTAAIAAGTAAIILLWMTSVLTWVGQAQSFDTMLYARSLWGLGHGTAYNPIVGTHALAVHGHFLQLPLAPLTQLFRAVDVLNVAHSLSAGAALAVMVLAAARVVNPTTTNAPATNDDGLDADPGFLAVPRWLGGSAGTIAVVCFATALLCSPLFLNPFTFGSRPDSLGIPLLVIAAVRAHERGIGDRIALACLAGGLLAREEYMFFIVGLAVCSPWRISQPADSNIEGPNREAGYRNRGIVAAVAIAYWLLYWFVLRDVFGGEFAVARTEGAHATLLGGGRFFRRFARLWAFKLEILTCAATFGGVAWLGWRKLPAAAAGLLMLLLMNRLGERTLVFHYSFFMLPGLCAMALDGLQRLSRWPLRLRLAAVFVGTSTAIAMGALSSSTPLGGRYEPVFFDPSLSHRVNMVNTAPALADIPPDAALVIPYELGAAFVDREFIGRADQFSWNAEHLRDIEWVWVVINHGRNAVRAREHDMLDGFERVSVGAGVGVYVRR